MTDNDHGVARSLLDNRRHNGVRQRVLRHLRLREATALGQKADGS